MENWWSKMNIEGFQKWKKLGRVIETGTSVKGVDILHSMDPSIAQIKDDEHRLYFSNRNELNQSLIYSIDLSLDDPTNSTNFNPSPILLPGNSVLLMTMESQHPVLLRMMEFGYSIILVGNRAQLLALV